MARKQSSPADALERLPLLSGLSSRARAQLARSMKERTFPAGRRVITEGSGGVGFFIITDGKAAGSIGGEAVRVLGPGDYFGEMALLDGEARTASVTADTELTCLTMTAWAFKSFVADNPQVGWVMLQTLVERLREASVR
jgi:CRP-like cAMP-binding protein